MSKEERIKIIVSIRFNTTSNRKFEKNRKKIIKIKKYHNGFFWRQNRLEKDEKERK